MKLQRKPVKKTTAAPMARTLIRVQAHGAASYWN